MSEEYVAPAEKSVSDHVLTQTQKQRAKPTPAQSNQNKRPVSAFVLLAVLFLLSVVVIGASGRLLVNSFHLLDAEKQLSNASVLSEESLSKEQFSKEWFSDELAIAMHNLVDTNDPDGLLLLAAYQAVLASKLKVTLFNAAELGIGGLGSGTINYAATNDLNLPNLGFAVGYDQAILTLRQAQALRPMHAKAFVMEAEYQWRNGATFEQILKPLKIAQHNAPYDKSVALFGLELYLAYWPRLDVDQRVLATSYLFDARRYRISKSQINAIIARSPEKQRACRLMDFNHVWMRACQ